MKIKPDVLRHARLYIEKNHSPSKTDAVLLQDTLDSLVETFMPQALPSTPEEELHFRRLLLDEIQGLTKGMLLKEFLPSNRAKAEALIHRIEQRPAQPVKELVFG